jgi:hypothetical protein
MKIRYYSCILLALCLFFSGTQMSQAQCGTSNSVCVGSDCSGIDGTVEVAYGDSADGKLFGTFKRDTGDSSYNGYVKVNTDTSRIRSGTASVKHAVWTSSTVPRMRAELNDNGMNKHPRKDSSGNLYTYWYGWSFYIPDNAQWQTSDLQQYIGQWRYQNSSAIAGDCIDSNYCSGAIVGGSGHHITYENGNMVMAIAPQDPNCTKIPRRVILIKKTLGTCPRGVWIDVVMSAIWTPSNSGRINVWVQRNGGGYTKDWAYSGPTWVDKYDTGCKYNPGGETTAPNWQVGLYFGNDEGKSTGPTENAPRIMYSDSIRMNRTLCSDGQYSDGWNRTRPAP